MSSQQPSGTERLPTEEVLRLLVDALEDHAICTLDAHGRVETWSAGAERIYGYAASEVMGAPCTTFYGDSELGSSRCHRDLDRARRAGPFSREGWLVRKDGTKFWASVLVRCLRDDRGAVRGFAHLTRDLSERRRAEERRRADEDRFQLLVQSVRDYAIFTLDPGGHVLTWNAGAERIKGYRAEEIIGSHFSRFYPESEVRAGTCEVELEGAARDGRFEDEGWRVRKDGSLFWANVVISAMRDATGRLVGFSKVTRDLTERRRTEQERAARLAAEEANRTKDQFLATLGHELRNPLAPILSALELIKLRGGAGAAREHDVIERQVRHLTRLVDELLDVSRIAQGKLELARERVDLGRAIAKAVEIAAPHFERRAQHFELKAAEPALAVHGDEGRLVQVFTNLLHNASKYTERGGHVVLEVRREPARVAIEVRDDGRGIDPALLPRVFERFVQGYQDSARSEGGLGLGLSLVEQLVRLHGGEVEAHSAGTGLGSSFTVRLPYEAGAGEGGSTRGLDRG